LDPLAIGRLHHFPDRVQAAPLPLARSVPPDLARLTASFARIVDNGRYSNFGPLQVEYAATIADALDCATPPLLFANATIALTTVLRALPVRGEVITTPFSFAASAHAIDWAGATPVFADIDPVTLTLDPERVAAAITPRTTAILAVHIYGHPCDHAGLSALASRHGLPLIYDAAHAFATRVDGAPIHHLGDATVYSLHASKLTHCGEGGVLVTRDPRLQAACASLQNFGIVDEDAVALCGSNGKLSEASAALGLAVLPGVAAEWSRRHALREQYRQALATVAGVTLYELPASVSQSEQYLVVRIAGGAARRDAVFRALREHRVFARRYFYPLCSDFPHYRHLASASRSNLPVSERAAGEMLCLPLHGGVSAAAVADIAFIIGETLALSPAQP